MTLSAFFADRGVAEPDAAGRATLLTQVTAGFAREFGGPPSWRWFVPGRLEVFGKHTDYCGGQVLVAALPRGFAVAARPRADGRVLVIDVANGVSAQLTVADSAPARTGWASYVDVTLRRLAANFPGAPLGLELAFGSNMPRAAGASSSSALVIAVATALVTRGRLTDREEWRQAIHTPEDHATYCGCIESGAGFGPLAGAPGVGTHGGSEDHTAILLGQPGRLGHYRFVPTQLIASVPCPADWTFVVATSGVHADKAGAVRDRYNRATELARTLVRLWNQAMASAEPSLAAIVAQPFAVDELSRLARSAASDAAPLLDRLQHFVAEDALVAQAAAASATGDAAAMGESAQASQRHAEALLQNQVPQTATLAALARECGAHGGTSFGAGFGGGVWALVSGGDVPAFAQAWLAAYTARHPGMTNVSWFAARPGPGVLAVPVDLA